MATVRTARDARRAWSRWVILALSMIVCAGYAISHKDWGALVWTVAGLLAVALGAWEERLLARRILLAEAELSALRLADRARRRNHPFNRRSGDGA